MARSLLAQARVEFHSALLIGTLTTDSIGIPSNADRSSAQSKLYARSIAQQLASETVQERAAGQTLGGNFEKAVAEFVQRVLPRLEQVRPGDWEILRLGNSRSQLHLAGYEPYLHLGALDRAVADNPELLTVLGNAYAICPDVVVTRAPVSDEFLNREMAIVDEKVGKLSSLRLRYENQPRILHAVISCKWTLRSDRAQNARSEALNLIRNRKGRTPHIMVVTGEPELEIAVAEHGNPESQELLAMMINGNRLRDIADLPLDLAI
jgi:NgoMIV restriction enzyme